MYYFFSVQNFVSYRDHIFFFYFNEIFIIIKCVFDHIEKFNKFQTVGKLQITIFEHKQIEV